MSLAEHLRELRNRILKAILAVIAGGVVGFIFYQPILRFLVEPFNEAADESGITGAINFASIGDPFTVPLKLALLVGFIIGAPVWIYQIWAFITPALYRREKRWAVAVIAASVPLFLGGIALCLWLLPHGLLVLLNFTPDGVNNIVAFNDYLSFVIRLIVVFGIAFLLPVFVVLLNAVGVLSGEALSSARRWIILGVFIFAAAATPTGDPVTLLFLALPMYALFEAAVIVCRLIDRRRARHSEQLGDDEATPDADLDAIGRTDEVDDR